MRETHTRTIKKDIISSELNEDGDAGANGGRGLRAKTETGEEKKMKA